MNRIITNGKSLKLLSPEDDKLFDTAYGKKVKVICFNEADNLIGTLSGWTSELDNEPDGESIIVDVGIAPYEVYIEDIKAIVVL
jgi:hypothetical protein